MPGILKPAGEQGRPKDAVVAMQDVRMTTTRDQSGAVVPGVGTDVPVEELEHLGI